LRSNFERRAVLTKDKTEIRSFHFSDVWADAQRSRTRLIQARIHLIWSHLIAAAAKSRARLAIDTDHKVGARDVS
jgi:hypothetical protein